MTQELFTAFDTNLLSFQIDVTSCQTSLCKLIGATGNEDGLVLMANDQAAQLLRPAAKGRH